MDWHEQDCALACSNFVNGINKTPNLISVDKEHHEVIVAIQGTPPLEDVVIDLQLMPSDLSELGVWCGFNGDGENATKECSLDAHGHVTI
jgi:hypothetical protein